MRKNPRNPLMDLNSDETAKRVNLASEVGLPPHYYEVKIPNHPNGVPQIHVGNIKDVERILEMYPDAI